MSSIYLKENAKQKDQTIRKYEQEIDSLQFRNDQVNPCYRFLTKMNEQLNK